MKPLLITDASVLVNLLATEAFEDIAVQAGWRFVICEAVQLEVLAVRNADTGEMEEVELQRFLDRNLIEVVVLDADAESDCYVEYAALVDDGEAMSLAIAETRKLAIALDDRRAISIAHRRGFSGEMLTTPDLLHEWWQKKPMSEVEFGELLRLMEVRARYVPPKNHALRQWWIDCRAKAGE